MQGPLRILSLITVSAVLVSGCGRKKPEAAKGPAPATSPVTETAASEQSALNAAGRDSTAPAHPAAIDIPKDAPMATAPADVPAELAKSDEVYEAWFRKYHLDLNDPKMLDSDPDGDGVSNRDEFMADTDPHDPKSHPVVAGANTPAHAALRLKQFNEVRLPVILESVDGDTAKIKRLDAGDRVESVKEGQSVPGLGYKVEKVQRRQMTDKHGVPVDASRVTLEDPATREKTVIVKDMPARSGSSYAVLTSDDGKTITVKQGDTFTWPQTGGTTYKVVDLRADQAVLQEEGSGRMYTVTKK